MGRACRDPTQGHSSRSVGSRNAASGQHCPPAGRPIRAPHVRGPLPVVRGSRRARGERPAVAALRTELARRGLTGWIVPRADEHQGEYQPASEERLKWLTGFTGSAGLAVIVLTDRGAVRRRTLHGAGARAGRYRALRDRAPGGRRATWIAAKLGKGGTVGFDPWLHTGGEIDRLGEALRGRGAQVEAARAQSRRPRLGPRAPFPAAAAIVAASDRATPASRRGEDRRCPGQARQGWRPDASDPARFDLLAVQHPRRRRRPQSAGARLRDRAGEGQARSCSSRPRSSRHEVRAPGLVAKLVDRPPALKERIAALREAKKRVRLDPETPPRTGSCARSAARKASCAVPTRLALKARKNAAEIAGARAAHLRDGAAMVRFPRLARPRGAGRHARRDHGRRSAGGLPPRDQRAAQGDQLRHDRRLRPARRHRALPRDAGDEPHAAARRAVPRRFRRPVRRRHHRHHAHGRDRRADAGDARALHARAQGPHRHRRARFPRGVRGIDLDPFARAFLWTHGLDYDHGTGHGVGSYLSVHEGPQSISKAGMVALEPGMILLQRARLLQGRRLRHPHREPGAGRRARRPAPTAKR